MKKEKEKKRWNMTFFTLKTNTFVSFWTLYCWYMFVNTRLFYINIQVFFFLAWIPRTSSHQWNISRNGVGHLQTEAGKWTVIYSFFFSSLICWQTAKHWQSKPRYLKRAKLPDGKILDPWVSVWNRSPAPWESHVNLWWMWKTIFCFENPPKCSVFCYCSLHCLLLLMPSKNHL